MEKTRINKNGELEVTSDVIIQVFGISRETLRGWQDKGCPKVGRGWWNLKDFIAWRGLTVNQGKAKSNEVRKLEAEADFKHAKARQEELRLMEMMKQLVPVEMVKDMLSLTFTGIRQELLNIPSQIRTEVHTLYPEASVEVTDIAEKTVRKCLERLAESDYTGTGISLERATDAPDSRIDGKVPAPGAANRKRVGRPKKGAKKG